MEPALPKKFGRGGAVSAKRGSTRVISAPVRIYSGRKGSVRSDLESSRLDRRSDAKNILVTVAVAFG